MTLFLILTVILPGRISDWDHYTHFGGVSSILVEDSTVTAASTGGVAFGTMRSGTVEWDSTWTFPGEISSSDARCLALDDDGNLWIGTYGGGIDVGLASGGFQHYGQLEGLPISLEINCIIPDTTIWVGTTEGLCSKELGYFNVWTVFTTGGGLPSNIVNCIAQGDSGLFVGTSSGLVSLKAGASPEQPSSWTSYSELQSLNIRDVLVQDDTVWVATNDGLLRSDDHAAFQYVSSFPSEEVPVSLDWMDGVLAVGNNGSIAVYADSTWILGAGILGSQVIQDVKWLDDGNLLLGMHTEYAIDRASGFGVAVGYPNTWNFSYADGAPSNDLRCVTVDSRDDVWITTNRCGAAVLSNGDWTGFRTELVSPNQVFACDADRSGGVFLAPWHFGVTWIDWNGTPDRSDDEIVLFDTQNSDILNDQIKEVAVSDNGCVWFAQEPYWQSPSEPSGVSRLTWNPGESETASWSLFQPTDGLPSGYVRSVETTASADEAWMGTQEGLVLGNVQTGMVLESYSELDGLPSSDIQSLARSRTGELFVGTSSGLAVIDIDSGNLNEVEEVSGIVSMLCLDNLSALWAIGSDALFRIYPDGSVEEYNTINSPLQSLNVRYADVDPDNGYLFLATDHGLWRLHLEQGMSGELSTATVYPNPFLPGKGQVLGLAGLPDDEFDLHVFDLNGSLVYESLSQYRDSFSWDGNDSDGVPVATGTYFVRISQNGNDRLVKLAIVR